MCLVINLLTFTSHFHQVYCSSCLPSYSQRDCQFCQPSLPLNDYFLMSFTTMPFVLLEAAQRRKTLTVFAMGSASSNHLGIPPGKGPNTVGCTDFMVDHTTQVDQLKNDSFWLRVCKISVTMDMSLRDECLLQGSLFRLYYPCQDTASTEKPDWIPSREYFNGLADFMKINRTLSERIFNYLFGTSSHLMLVFVILKPSIYTACSRMSRKNISST